MKTNKTMKHLFTSSLALGMCTTFISPYALNTIAYQSEEKARALNPITKDGVVSLGEGEASIILLGNPNQSLADKEIALYRLFDATPSSDSQSIHYSLNPKYEPAIRKVVAKKLSKDENELTEAEIIAYFQSLNSNPVNGVDSEQELEGRYSDFRYFVEELRDELDLMQLYPKYISIVDTKVDGSVEFTGLEYGYYLIDETTYNNGFHQASSLCMVDTASPQAIIQIKSDYPTLEKKLQEDDLTSPVHSGLSDVNGWNDIGDFEIGQNIPYRYHTTVPNMSGYETYYLAFHDVMDDALTFNPSSLQIQISFKTKVYTLSVSDYNLVLGENNETFTIKIDDLKAIVDREFPEGLNEKGESDYGQLISVTYHATLNDNAAHDIGRPGFENHAKLEFSNNPDTDMPWTTGETPWDSVVCFTYKINGLKVNNENTKLEGAQFALFSDEACLNEVLVKKVDHGYHVMNHDTANVENAVTMVSNAEGVFTIFGLDQGTYYLKETQAPTGYSEITHPIKITITPTYTNDRQNYVEGDGATDKTLQALNTTAFVSDFINGSLHEEEFVLDTDLDEGASNLTVVNTAGQKLPITGSNATIIMLGTGSIMMLAALKKKKEQK